MQPAVRSVLQFSAFLSSAQFSQRPVVERRLTHPAHAGTRTRSYRNRTIENFSDAAGAAPFVEIEMSPSLLAGTANRK